LYAVVPCSPPPDPLGEPDMTYKGVRMYSVGRFKQYIEWWKKYVYVLADIYHGCKPIRRVSGEMHAKG